MRSRSLGSAVTLGSAAAQAAVTNDVTPYIRNRAVAYNIAFTIGTGSPVAKIQQSDDNSTWSDDVTISATGNYQGQLTLKKYTRLNVTTAGTNGTVSANLLADV